MNNKKSSKQDSIEQELEAGLLGIFTAIGQALRMAWTGLRSMRSPPQWIGFGVCAAICAAALLKRRELWALDELFGRPLTVVPRVLLIAVPILLPLLYLIVIGSQQKDESGGEFEQIGFVNKDGSPPKLAYKHEEKHVLRSVQVYGYTSYIPLERWRKEQANLEVALNRNIRSIRQGTDKRTVELATVSNEVKMPERVPWSDDFIQEEDGKLCIGEDLMGPVTFNLNSTPHVIVAGETGSGKSVILRAILWQMVNQGAKIFMIDFKGGVEFGPRFEEYGEVITDRARALIVFQMLVEENTARLALFRENEVKKLPEYNQKYGANLCRIAVFIDEIAEMLDKSGVDAEEKELIGQLEGCLSTLARLSRATGINLIIGVQRPDAKILTGQIKNNVPVRICGRFADRAPSEIVLGNTMAMDLPDVKGRFLYRMGNEMTEFQAYLFDDDKNLHDVDIEQGELLIDRGRKQRAEPSPAAASSKGKGDTPKATHGKRAKASERPTAAAPEEAPPWDTDEPDEDMAQGEELPDVDDLVDPADMERAAVPGSAKTSGEESDAEDGAQAETEPDTADAVEAEADDEPEQDGQGYEVYYEDVHTGKGKALPWGDPKQASRRRTGARSKNAAAPVEDEFNDY